MAGFKTEVFVSSTTKDLGSYRTLVSDTLGAQDIFPVVQERFDISPDSLPVYIEKKIAPVDYVICLIGPLCGAFPKDQGGDIPRSYTQMEYDFARKQKKIVFAFYPSRDCPLDPHDPETPGLQEMQRAHLENIMETVKCELFTSADNLKSKIEQLIHQLNPGRLPTRFVHPPPKPVFFAGRAFEQDQFRKALSEKTPAVVAVLGIGGQGKTTLLSETINDLERDDAGLFWCTAYDQGFLFDHFLDEILEWLTHGQFVKMEHPGIPERSRIVIKKIQQRPYLVVIDGIERWLSGWRGGASPDSDDLTPDRRAGRFEGLDDFLGQMSSLENGTHLILSSRALPAVLDRRLVRTIPVYAKQENPVLCGLDDQAAVELLKQLKVTGTDEELSTMAHAYGNHPLALSVLAGIMKNLPPNVSPYECFESMKGHNDLTRLLDEARRNLPGGRKDERLLQVMAHFEEDPTLDLLVSLASEPALELAEKADSDDVRRRNLREHLVSLDGWNIISWNAADQVAKLHMLIKDFFVDRASDSRAIHAALSQVYENCPVPDSVSTLQEAKPRLLAIHHATASEDPKTPHRLAAQPLGRLGSLVEWTDLWGHAAIGLEQLRSLAKASTGTQKARYLCDQGPLLLKLGRLDQAYAVLSNGLEVYRSCGFVQRLSAHLLETITRMNRANIPYERGLYADALEEYDGALASLPFWNRRSRARLLRAKLLMNKGNTLKGLGALTPSIECLTKAITIFETNGSGPESGSSMLAKALMNRSNVYGDLDRFAESEQDLRKAVAHYQELIDSGVRECREQKVYAELMLAANFYDAGNHQEARSRVDETLRAFDALLRENLRHVERFIALGWLNRGLIDMKLCSYDEMVEDATKAIAIYARLIKDGHDYLEGLHAHARIIQGIALSKTGQIEEGRRVRHDAFTDVDRWIADGKTYLRRFYLKKAVDGFRELHETDPADAQKMIRAAAVRIRSAIANNEVTEQLVVTGCRARNKLDLLTTKEGPNRRAVIAGFLSACNELEAYPGFR